MLNMFTCCIKSNDIQYSTIEKQKTHCFEITNCIYVSNNKKYFKNAKNVNIRKDHIHLQNDIVNFKFITNFFDLSYSTIGIKILGNVNENSNINICESYMLIILKFSTYNAKINFINFIFKKIKKFKNTNNNNLVLQI